MILQFANTTYEFTESPGCTMLWLTIRQREACTSSFKTFSAHLTGIPCDTPQKVRIQLLNCLHQQLCQPLLDGDRRKVIEIVNKMSVKEVV